MRGARHVVITDINDYRLELATKMGATRAVNTMSTKLEDVMKELGMTEGFDVGLRNVGVYQLLLNQMLKTMNHGGKVALGSVFLQVTWRLIGTKSFSRPWVIKAHLWPREMFETWYKMAGVTTIRLRLVADDYA